MLLLVSDLLIYIPYRNESAVIFQNVSDECDVSGVFDARDVSIHVMYQCM